MKREYDFSRAKRGAVDPLPSGNTRIAIRLDDAILEWFKAPVHAVGGGKRQSLINAALAGHIQCRKEPLEEIPRRVIREELPGTSARPRHVASHAGGV